jgi:predicted RNA-binding protein YlqC (UPF0109 family)
MGEVVVSIKGEGKKYRFRSGESIEQIKTVVGLNSLKDKLNREMTHTKPQITQTMKGIQQYIKDVLAGKKAKEFLDNMDQLLVKSLQGDKQATNELMMEFMPGGGLITKGGKALSEINGIPILKASTPDELTEIIEELTKSKFNIGEDIGFRGIGKGEVGKKELGVSMSTMEGFDPEELPGKSVMGGEIDEFIDDIEFFWDKVRGYGSTDYIAVVKGKPVGPDVIANDVGESVLKDAEAVAYILRDSLK